MLYNFRARRREEGYCWQLFYFFFFRKEDNLPSSLRVALIVFLFTKCEHHKIIKYTQRCRKLFDFLLRIYLNEKRKRKKREKNNPMILDYRHTSTGVYHSNYHGPTTHTFFSFVFLLLFLFWGVEYRM